MLGLNTQQNGNEQVYEGVCLREKIIYVYIRRVYNTVNRHYYNFGDFSSCSFTVKLGERAIIIGLWIPGNSLESEGTKNSVMGPHEFSVETTIVEHAACRWESKHARTISGS